MVPTAERPLPDAPTLTDDSRTTLVRVLHVAFPHESVPDGPYERTADAVIEAADASTWSRLSLVQGLESLAGLTGDGFLELDDADATKILRHVEGTEFFGLIRRTAVVSLYDDHEVWSILGYEGESFAKGGYIDRGFDDLDWLPDPRIEEYDGPDQIVEVAAVLPEADGTQTGQPQGSPSTPGVASRRRTAAGSRQPDGAGTVWRPSRSTSAVVVIGSGAGGGTMAYELTAKGIPCVVLEAGPFLKPDDYENDEWAAFGQMAWLDNRTTSGPLPGGTATSPTCRPGSSRRSAARTTHWSGATPRFRDYEFKAQDVLRRRRRAPTCSTGRSRWPTSRRTTTGPRRRSARRTGTAARRCRRTTTTRCSRTAPRGSVTRSTPPAPTARTPSRTTAARRPSRTASTSRATSTPRSGAPPSARSRGRIATGKCDLRTECQAVQITHDAQGKRERRALPRQGGQSAPAGRQGGLRRRQLDRDRRGCCC